MIQRSAPAAGYDVGTKRQYRRAVWRTLHEHCPVPMAEARVFMLPSSDGDEIEVALRHGIREYNIDICDRNPAIVASLKRRYPMVTSHGIPAERVFRERTQLYDLINLDLCTTAGRNLPTSMPAAACLSNKGVMAVTWLKGRDGGAHKILTSISDAFNVPVDRAALLDAAISVGHAIVSDTRRGMKRVRLEQYVCGRVPMQWAVWRGWNCPDEAYSESARRQLESIWRDTSSVKLVIHAMMCAASETGRMPLSERLGEEWFLNGWDSLQAHLA